MLSNFLIPFVSEKFTLLKIAMIWNSKTFNEENVQHTNHQGWKSGFFLFVTIYA